MSKGEKTRRKILEKAAPLFNKRGFNGCSMQDISAATGLEKGSLYTHFHNKEQLALEAFDTAWAQSSKARVDNLDKLKRPMPCRMDLRGNLQPFLGQRPRSAMRSSFPRPLSSWDLCPCSP